MLPFAGVRVVDLSHQGPGPHCTMLLGDFGADVVVVERHGVPADGGRDPRSAAFMATRRNKRSICLDLKNPQARDVFDTLADRADVIVEAYRPGVAKRLGVDFETLQARNARLVYCSISGYGQTGPWAKRAGHDINYIATTGALAMIGTPDGQPVLPMNLVADYGGGAMLAAFAIATALFVRHTTGRGQFIDLAMSDGVISQLGRFYSEFFQSGAIPRSGRHMLNGGWPHYATYRCADDRFIAVGPLELHLFANLCRGLGLEALAEAATDPARHDEIRTAFAQRFASRSREQWLDVLEPLDACVTAVDDLSAAAEHPHHRAREMFVEVEDRDGARLPQIGVTPKFSETPGSIRRAGVESGADAEAILGEAGYEADRITALRDAGVI